MDVEEKLALAMRPPTEEVLTLEELRHLFETTPHPRHYIGLEISGLLHLGISLLSAFKIRDLQRAGVRCSVFLADWHSVINQKLGGDWQTISEAAKYFEEAFRFLCPGVEVVKGSELYHNNDTYWRNVVKLSGKVTLARMLRCLTIMGRTKREAISFAQLIYPPMQAADIKALDVDIAHAGTDQRRIHVIAREIFPMLGWKKPIVLHHRLLPGLAPPAAMGFEEKRALDVEISSKMSKSKPWTCIFIHDGCEAIKQKLAKAWCPPQVEGNPVLALVREVVFHERRELRVERSAKYGGDVTFGSYDELERAYLNGLLHASDLKAAVAVAIDEIIAPIREHFEKKPELLEPFKRAGEPGLQLR